MSEVGKGFHKSREAEKRQNEAIKKDLITLIYHYLTEEGFSDTAEIFQNELNWDVRHLEVCDNIDLLLIFQEFLAYYQIKFYRKPKITKAAKNDVNMKTPLMKRRPITYCEGKENLRVNSAQPIKNILIKPPKEVNFIQLEPTVNSFEKPFETTSKYVLDIPKSVQMNDELKDMAQAIARDVFNSSDDTSQWKDVIGHDEAKEAIEDHLIYPMMYPDIYEELHQTNGTDGILLYGPPGTGKTMLARAAAKECGVLFLNVHSSTLTSKWRGESEKMVRILFELARHNAPCIVFIDEVDSVMGERGVVGEHEASRRCKAELLIQLDGLEQTTEKILFLGATNLPWMLDPAVLRRFQKQILIDLPSVIERKLILQNNLKMGPTTISKKFDFTDLSERTEHFSGADLVALCRSVMIEIARRKVKLRQNSNNKSQKQSNLKLEIRNEDVMAHLSIVKPIAQCYNSKYASWQKGDK